MKLKKIKKRFKSGKLNFEKTMELLSKKGFSPSLVHDDNGHWAISGDGIQNIPTENKTQDVSLTVFVELKKWKKTIKKAMLHYLNEK
jgi:hypothetical protein